MAPERRYPLRKLAAGDYLLSSNDGRTLLRICRHEDGPSHGLDDWPRDRWFWQALRWPEPVTSSTRLSKRYDVDDLSRWHEIATHLDTRRDAIDAALRFDPRGGAR